MRYQGGKARAAKHIAAAIKATGVAGPFWEPFCGGLSMSVALAEAFGAGLHSDANAALIALYAAHAAGWRPPAVVTEAEYAAARRLPDSDPLKAFCAVGCSFGGKWFGGYARDATGMDYCGAAGRALARDVPKLADVPFVASFLATAVEPATFGFLYCDPPYAGTTGYAGAGAFDSAAFWRKAEAWSGVCPVFVSEYAAPPGWRAIWERAQTTCLGAIGKTKAAAVERLFVHG